MSRILRFLMCLFCIVFIGDAVFAASYECPTYRKYTTCNPGYYLAYSYSGTSGSNLRYYSTPRAGNACRPCSDYDKYEGVAEGSYYCEGGKAKPVQMVTVTYNLNGGDGSVPSPELCTPNSTCPLVKGNTTSFYRAGYVFKGWTPEGSTSDKVVDFDDFVPGSENMTLYAVWVPCGSGEYKPGSGTQAAAACSQCPELTPRFAYVPTTGNTSLTACRQGIAKAEDVNEYCATSSEATEQFDIQCQATSDGTWGDCAIGNAWTAKPGSYVGIWKQTMPAEDVIENMCIPCGVGTYSEGGLINSCSACSGDLQYQNLTGQTSCKTVDVGYYKSSNSAQARCPVNYRDIAATSQANCQGTFEKIGSQLTPDKQTGCAERTLGTCSPGTCEYTKKYSGTIVNDCTPTDCTKPQTCTSADDNYYLSGGSAAKCGSSYPYSDGGNISSSYCYKYGTKTGSQVNGSVPTNCASVTSWNSCTPGTCQYKDYNGATDGTCTPSNCTKTPKAVTAKENFYVNGTSCSACPSGYPKSDGGNISSAYCYVTKTKTGSQVNGSVPTNCASVTSWNSCTPGTCSYRDYQSATDTTCTPSNCTKTPAAVTADAGYYDDGTSCSACPSAYPNSADGNEGGDTKCYASVSGGHYIGTRYSATQSECEGGTYKAAHTVYYGSTSSCSACTGRTKYSGDGASSCKTVSSGYYTTGCNTSGNNCTGQSRCTGATYCSSGVQNSCPEQTSGWTRNGGTGWTTYTQCNQTRAATSISTYCSAGTLKQNATSATAWGATTVSSALSAKAGAYVNGTTCSQCTADNYCTGGTAARKDCPSGYPNSAAGSDAITDCYSNTKSRPWSGSQVNGTTPTNCYSATWGNCRAEDMAACSYVAYSNSDGTADGTVKSGCESNSKNCTRQVASVTAKSGYYDAGTTCSECPNGYPNSANGNEGGNTKCYASVSGGHYIGTKNSATQSECVGGTYKAAHTVYYGSTSSCSACTGRTKYSGDGASACSTVTSGYYSTGCNTSGNKCTGQSQCTGATYCSGGVQNSCPAQTSGWTRNGGTGWTTYTQCNQTRAATSISTYCSAGTLKQNATSATAWGATTVSSALSAKAGAYVNGTTCSQCTADNYCTGGTAAPKDCPSGYPNSDAGASAITKCYSNTKSRAWIGSQNACTKPSGCSTVTCNSCSMSACEYVAYANTAGTADGTVKSGCSTNNESCNQTVKSVTANPGYKVNGTACAICTGATYSAGGAATSCSNCPTIYTDNTASGKKAATECQVVTDGGYYIAANNDDAQTICGVRNYCPSATVNYGSHNSPIACPTASEHLRTTYPDNYYNPTSATATNQTWGDGKDAITDCKAVYMITNARGRFTVESTGYNAETEKYDVGGTKYYTKVNPGYYVKDRLASTYCNDTSRPMYYTDAQPCPAGSYCPGLSSMPSCSSGEYTETNGINSCPANYGNSPAMSDAATDCYLTTTAKNFVATPNAAQTTCTAGGYCVGGVKVNYGSTGGRTPASKGYYVSTTGATTQTPCAAGTYTSSTGQTKCTDAAAGTYTTGCQSTSNNTACTGTAVCATNKYSNARASVCIACNTADGYGNSGTTAASHAGQASCKVTCGGGEYVPTAGGGCVNVGVGYWGAGGTVSETSTLARSQCESGLTTIGSGAGADEVGDCGRVLNVNGEKIYLRSTKKTTPSLNVSINGDVFYGNMGASSIGALKLKSNGTTYSVYDDSMQ